MLDYFNLVFLVLKTSGTDGCLHPHSRTCKADHLCPRLPQPVRLRTQCLTVE